MRRRVGRGEDLGAEGKGGVWGTSRTASEAVETAAEEDQEAVEEGERDGRTTLHAHIRRSKMFFFRFYKQIPVPSVLFTYFDDRSKSMLQCAFW